MKVDEKIVNRIQELENRAAQLMQTKITKGGGTGYVGHFRVENPTFHEVDYEMANQWGMSCLHILKLVFTSESDHYIEFKRLFPDFAGSSNYRSVKEALGILKAAKDDFENGYLFKTRALIEAEVFNDFLDQAEYLLKSGYYAPAAVIAGSVLEDGLRKLCQREAVPLPARATIDPMNVELTRAGVYNSIIQKKITALADIRNKAAHGKWNEFNSKDVGQMITQVRSFMEDHFS